MTTPEVVDLGDVVFAKRPALVSGASFFNLSCCLFKPRPFIGAGQGHRNLEFPDLVETSQFARSLRSPGIRGVQWVGRNYIQPGGVGERSPPKNPGTSSKPLWFDGHCFALQRALVLSTSDATKSGDLEVCRARCHHKGGLGLKSQCGGWQISSLDTSPAETPTAPKKR